MLRAPLASTTDAPGNCVEWIVEAPTIGSELDSIPDVDSVEFTRVSATRRNGTYLGTSHDCIG